MKIHGSGESREAQAASEASGLEREEGKKNLNKIKENKECKKSIGHKATKRWTKKMQRGEESQRSLKKAKKAKCFEDNSTDQPMAFQDDCSGIQGGLLICYLLIMITNSSFICVVLDNMMVRSM